MIHPMIIHGEDSTVLVVCGEYLKRLLEKPRPILWVRADDYRWVPIEHVRAKIDQFKADSRLSWTENVCFVLANTVEIPREAGDVIVKYNGHDE